MFDIEEKCKIYLGLSMFCNVEKSLILDRLRNTVISDFHKQRFHLIYYISLFSMLFSADGYQCFVSLTNDMPYNYVKCDHD